MIKIGVSGGCGRMGKRIIKLAKEDKDFTVVFGLENKEYSDVGKIIDGVRIGDDPQEVKKCDCLIDFSAPQATVGYIPYLVEFRKCAVIGTTGLDEDQQNKVKEAAKNIPIVFSPNMSVGVNLLFKLIDDAAKILKGYQVDIEEAHHIHKKDAPSGTAKKIAKIINEQGFSIKVEDIKAERVDEIVGDHKVVFESDVDKIELFHSAKTRDIFAQGALLAAKWIIGKSPGLYSMDDVLFGAKF
ncbi:MAG: 4-hydroxy-tetrahydrodipicolinate reductase [Candidatus Omnitrophica bacterium]|nr:4-hydroxy-tetrahydrodipicolinate reductase [Candidatus Omnitrophota bacterium]MBU1134113.1 4-hydroxy-tetrahydrodipicolinate reductase [Candidatus Omnitrophota bacterium]MBU1366469.1 4-hydroxy-tetrahydrodipicolinate reductase [Candidatus Omnitrophota bacterium]MBU1523444.1 4-hydroxy-tetrahydrodipicolinate reductase [Candidatus Omnitrophota bacterium]MBU1810094.1 4-hydroxy-tetrahydrodipicolinate reductase [Candidatus Omnitrophota bacterium]